jgi:hypothetical protein
MWALWPAIIILAVLSAVGGVYVHRQRGLYIDAKVRQEYETADTAPAAHKRHPSGDVPRRPKTSTVIIAAAIVFGLLAAAVALLVDTIANS